MTYQECINMYKQAKNCRYISTKIKADGREFTPPQEIVEINKPTSDRVIDKLFENESNRFVS